VAPFTMKQRFLLAIKDETKNAQKGKPAQIIAKINSLEDPTIIQALYEASQAGVKISLIVRGFCMLKPGVKDLSENIKVISIIGRFLEHSRIFYFANAMTDPSQGNFFLGSADWMFRNLTNRIEVITPILDLNLKERLWNNLTLSLNDQRQAWDLNSNGSYTQRMPKRKDQALGSQETQMNLSRKNYSQE